MGCRCLVVTLPSVRPEAGTTADPSVQRVELSVGDATCALRPDQVRDIIAALLTAG